MVVVVVVAVRTGRKVTRRCYGGQEAPKHTDQVAALIRLGGMKFCGLDLKSGKSASMNGVLVRVSQKNAATVTR